MDELCNLINFYLGRVWKYQRGNHNPQIEEKGQKDKKPSTIHIKLKIEEHVPH